MKYIFITILLIGSMAYFEIPDLLKKGQLTSQAENYEGSIQDQATEVVPINLIHPGRPMQTLAVDSYNKMYEYLVYYKRIVRDKKDLGSVDRC
jgi:hypothetical protein